MLCKKEVKEMIGSFMEDHLDNEVTLQKNQFS